MHSFKDGLIRGNTIFGIGVLRSLPHGLLHIGGCGADRALVPGRLRRRYARRRRAGPRRARSSPGRWPGTQSLRRSPRPRRDVRKAYEQNPEAVARWLEVEYPAIAKRAKREKAVILWLDQTGLRSDAPVGKTWAPVGKTPVVSKTGKRFGTYLHRTLRQGAVERCG
jgi:hypothetical protein